MRIHSAIIGLAMLIACSNASFAIMYASWYDQPCYGDYFLDDEDITVTTHGLKNGCTEAAGPCPDLVVTIYYKRASQGIYTAATMTYFGDDGSMDLYSVQIPAAATAAGDPEQYYILWHDVTDNSDNSPWDHCGMGDVPPMVLNIVPPTSQDVLVTFCIDWQFCPNSGWLDPNSLTEISGDFNGWAECDPSYQLSDPEGDLNYCISINFPAGSMPYRRYRFQLFDPQINNCNTDMDRSFFIDDSGPTQSLPIVTWNDEDCCTPQGPTEVTGAGSFCVQLCLCDEMLYIPLNTNADPPLLGGISFRPGCQSGTACSEVCSPGAGAVNWTVVGQPGAWQLALCITRGPGAQAGCFCATIDDILPVEFGSFEAVGGDNRILLRWNTRSESDNARFDIERDGALLAQVPSQGNSTNGHGYSYVDLAVANETRYLYELFSVDLNGARVRLGTAAATPAAMVAAEYRLETNFPNPFNPRTSIRYSLAAAGLVNLNVYDLNGRLVSQLVNESQAAGLHRVDFEAGQLASGLYLFRLTSGSFTASGKMILMK